MRSAVDSVTQELHYEPPQHKPFKVTHLTSAHTLNDKPYGGSSCPVKSEMLMLMLILTSGTVKAGHKDK